MASLRLTTRITIAVAVIILLVAGVVFGGWMAGKRALDGPDPEVIAQASLEGLREQNRLSAFMANYVAVVTATQTRMGLKAQKTLIMPGSVRYEVDLAKLRQEDLRWVPETRELEIVLPPVEVVGPQIDLTRIKEYDGGGLLMRFTRTGEQLDAANRKAGQAELLRQARAPVPMALAKDATRRAIERSFALPLNAAGLSATVKVRFPDEPDFPARTTQQIDHSRSLEDVYNNRAATR